MGKKSIDPKELFGETFQIVRFSKLHDTDKIFVTVRFNLPNFNYDKKITIPLSEVKSRKFSSYIPECFAITGVRPNQQAELLRMAINDALVKAKPVTLLPQGYSLVDGQWIFTLGDTLLNSDQDDKSLYAHNPKNLQWSAENYTATSTDAIFDWVYTYCQHGAEKAALFLISLTPLLKPITDQLGKFTHTVNAYVYGDTGTGKTSYAKMVTSLCNDTSQGANLSNSKANILSYLAECNDRAFLIDDFNLTSSSYEMAKKRATLSDLISMTNSGSTVDADGKTVDMNRIALVITAEELLKNASSIDRCLLVHMEKKIHSKDLTYLQDNSHLYTYFVVRFIEWLLKDKDTQYEYINEETQRGQYKLDFAPAPSTQYSGFYRISNAYKLMHIAARTVYRFFNVQLRQNQDKSERQLDSNRKEELKDFLGRLTNGCNKVVQDTLEQLKLPAKLTPIQKAVIELFVHDTNHVIAPSVWEYEDSSYKIFRYKKGFYFRGEKLVQYLAGNIPNISISTKKLSNELQALNLLVSAYSKDLSAPLPTEIADILQDEGKPRYYCIDVDNLIELLKSNYDSIDLQDSPIDELRLAIFTSKAKSSKKGK